MNTNPKIRVFKKQNAVFILLGFTMLFGCNLTAQDVVKAPDKPYFTISVGRMNILYVGIPNPVTIATSAAYKKLHISWGGATATELENGRYNVFVPDSLVNKTITITLSVETKKGKIQNLGSMTFRVKPIPEPIVCLGANIDGGRYPKVALLANPLITARVHPDFNFTLQWRVLSYDVTFIINGIVEPPITVQGPRFNEQVLNKIQEAPSGTVIEFSDIKIQSIAGMRDVQKLIVVRIH